MNDINTVRDALFAALAGLRDKDAPMDIERARAISNVAGKLLDSARVEIDYLRATGQIDSQGTGFIPVQTDEHHAHLQATGSGIVGIRRHLLK